MKDETHKLEKCKNEDYKPVYVTISKEYGFILRCDKCGKCKNALWSTIMGLAKLLPVDKVMSVFHDTRCENGYAGHHSCVSECYRLMKEKLDKEAKK